MKTKIIQVTQDDINNGERFTVYNCPVARALARAFKMEMWCYEDFGKTCDQKAIGKIPLHIKKWIIDFDLRRTVKPIEFEVSYTEI